MNLRYASATSDTEATADNMMRTAAESLPSARAMRDEPPGGDWRLASNVMSTDELAGASGQQGGLNTLFGVSARTLHTASFGHDSKERRCRGELA